MRGGGVYNHRFCISGGALKHAFAALRGMLELAQYRLVAYTRGSGGQWRAVAGSEVQLMRYLHGIAALTALKFGYPSSRSIEPKLIQRERKGSFFGRLAFFIATSRLDRSSL